MKIVIVGGVAGGANVATRARRLSESAEIVLVERGPYVSFANCGLPYHIGGEIENRDALIVQSPERLRRAFNIDVRVLQEVTAIDRENKTVCIRNVLTRETASEGYDHLVLSTGAAPLRPALPGIDLPDIFTLPRRPCVQQRVPGQVIRACLPGPPRGRFRTPRSGDPSCR